jgi:hypothetical protein
MVFWWGAVEKTVENYQDPKNWEEKFLDPEKQDLCFREKIWKRLWLYSIPNDFCGEGALRKQ